MMPQPGHTPFASVGETMTVAEHNVSRRALLGAALALPAGLGVDRLDVRPALLQRQQGRRWQLALAAFGKARADLDAASGDSDEDRFDNALGAFASTLRRLLRTPAPGLQALALKIELAVDHEVAILTGARPCLAVLKQDARRLAHTELQLSSNQPSN
jgi:hypothetical protein